MFHSTYSHLRQSLLDWRFRPRTVCKDARGHGVEDWSIGFDGCNQSYSVFRVPGGRLQTDRDKYVAINLNNRLLSGPSFQWRGFFEPELTPDESPAFDRGRIAAPPRRLKGTLLSLLNGWPGNENYYHWMTAILPRFHLAEKAGLLADVDLFLLPDDVLRFQVESLDFLQVPKYARISSKATPHVTADTIIATTHPRPGLDRIPPWIVEWIRGAFLTGIGDRKYSPLVYIGRADAGKRRLRNEEQCLKEVLEPLGFEAYQLSAMPLFEQIQLFAHAKVVVGIHGAGLTNLCFCEPGTTVIELFAAPWQLRMFENISKIRRLNYRAIVSENYETDIFPLYADFSISLEELTSALEACCALNRPRAN